MRDGVRLEYKAKMVAKDRQHDLAILKIVSAYGAGHNLKNRSFDFVALNPNSGLTISDDIQALGFPSIGRVSRDRVTLTVTNGKVAGFDLDEWIKVDLRIAPGNSGGMLNQFHGGK